MPPQDLNRLSGGISSGGSSSGSWVAGNWVAGSLGTRNCKPAVTTLEVLTATAEEERWSSRRTPVRGLHAAPAVSQVRRSCLQPTTAAPSREEEVR
jgi:hypothetical protein